MKRLLPFLPGMLIASTMLFSACGEKSTEAESSDPSQTDRRFITFGTAPPGGAFFIVGAGIAEVLQNAGSELEYSVSAESTRGSTENIRRLADGELDFAMSNAAVTYFAVNGKGEWENRAQDLRSIATMAPNVALFVSPENGGVGTIEELRGKRVVVGPAGSGMEYFIAPILEAHGLKYEDFTPLNHSQAGAVELLQDGSATAAFLGGAVPTASILQACATAPMNFLPYTAEARAALIKEYPFFQPATIPAGTYPGQEAGFEGLNVGSMHLILPASASDDFAYWLTKTIYEGAAKITEKHPAGKSLNPKNVVQNVGTPFHPGAIKYYREIGIWPESATPATNE